MVHFHRPEFCLSIPNYWQTFSVPIVSIYLCGQPFTYYSCISNVCLVHLLVHNIYENVIIQGCAVHLNNYMQQPRAVLSHPSLLFLVNLAFLTAVCGHSFWIPCPVCWLVTHGHHQLDWFPQCLPLPCRHINSRNQQLQESVYPGLLRLTKPSPAMFQATTNPETPLNPPSHLLGINVHLRCAKMIT